MSFQEWKEKILFFLGLDQKSPFVQDRLDLTNLRIAVPITIYTLIAERSMFNRTVLLWHLVSEKVYLSLFAILAICSVHLLIYSILYLFGKARSHRYASFAVYLYVIACCLAGQMIAIYDYAIGKQVFIFLPMVAWIFALMLINPVSSSIAAVISFYLIPTYTNNRVVMSNYVNRILMLFAVMLEIISIVRWITQRRSIHAEEEIKLMNDKLSEMSMKDELTGLKNRHALRQDYDRHRNQTIIASMCDIDDFKYYNDTYGHDAGDLILRHMGTILAKHFGHENVYRFGGDEFLIIVQGWSKEAFETAMTLWKKEFREFDYDGKRLHLSSTCGYCCGRTKEDDDLRQMISQADQKLYEGKMGQKGIISGCDYVRDEAHEEKETLAKGNLRPGQFDTVTHLPNLTYFRSKAPMSMEILRSSNQVPVLAYFNLENFGGYNRRYGYEAGDRLLKNVGELISETFKDDLVCRLSDDHFALITKKEGIEDRLSSLSEKMTGLSRDFPMNIRAGLFETSDRSVDISYACDCARQALEYGSKKDVYCWYDDKLRAIVKRRQYVRDQFETAVENGWITIITQPIIRAATKRVAGMEILSRWNDPKFGTLVPDDYIPLLEEAGRISDLDLLVLKKAVENYKNRANTDIPVVPWMINLSGRDFDRIDFVDRLLGIAEGVDPYLIALDISAAALSDAKPHVRKALQRLTEAGFNLWMDGFGFGNSAIDILSSYQISGIKVDIRSLQEVARGSSQSIMLSHIVSMCKDLSVSTLALGVETEEEMNFLREIGFEYVQGYYLSGKDSYDQYTARKDGTVYEIEPLQSRDYYTKISRVNLSRPTQVGKNSRIENLAADIPAAICEMRGSTISCIRTNKAFRQFLQAAGFSDVSAYENRLNDESDRLCRDSREVFRKLRDSDVWVTEKFAYDRLSLVASFHKISVDPIDDAVCVIGVVLDLSTYQKFSA